MTETYQHTFRSGRVCTARVTYRAGLVPDMDCTHPGGEFTPQEWPEYLEWRQFVAARVLTNLDPAAVALLALSGDDQDYAEMLHLQGEEEEEEEEEDCDA